MFYSYYENSLYKVQIIRKTIYCGDMNEKKNKTLYVVFVLQKQPKRLLFLQKKGRAKHKKWRVVVVKWGEVEYDGNTS